MEKKDFEKYIDASLWQRILILLAKDLWSAVSAVLGTISIIWSLAQPDSPVRRWFRWLIDHLMSILATNAHAAEPLGAAISIGGFPPKMIFICAMMTIIAFFFMWSLVMLSFSKSEKAIGIAQDAVKTISGFFIGAITGFLG